jgi:hypothetical protein
LRKRKFGEVGGKGLVQREARSGVEQANRSTTATGGSTRTTLLYSS